LCKSQTAISPYFPAILAIPQQFNFCQVCKIISSPLLLAENDFISRTWLDCRSIILHNIHSGFYSEINIGYVQPHREKTSDPL
jgi:hypothetical protein